MSAVSVRAALEGAVAAMSPALATAWENRPFDPPAASTAYQRVNVLFASPDNRENTASYEERGFMQVSLCYPQGAGAGAASTRAELIRTAFPRGRTITAGGITVTIERTPEIMPGRNEDDRFIIPVRIRFRAPVHV